jgi:hypothetical protein
LNRLDADHIGELLMNVFDFVEEMDKKYGDDWVENSLTSEESLAYDFFRFDWNCRFNLMVEELKEDN